MESLWIRVLFVTMTLAWTLGSLGCGDDGGETGDAGGADVTADATADVGDTSSADQGGQDTSDTGSTDTGTGDAGDGGGGDGVTSCDDFAGYYTTSGSCTGGVLEFPEAICVFQSECDITAYTEAIGTVFAGSVSASTASFSTSSPVAQSCEATIEGGGVDASCEVPAAGAECTGALTAAPSDLQLCCDLVGQNCPEGQRCQVHTLDAGLTSACIEVTGSVDVGDPCVRDESRGGFYDDCQAGLFCTAFGTPAGVRTCRAHCTDSSECAEGEACHISSGAPAAGRCLPLCSPFAEADTEGGCPTGTACRNYAALGGGPGSSMTMCLAAAETTAAEGEPCTGADSCEDGLWCHASVCRQPCDTEHPCDDDQTCLPYPGRFNVVPGFPAGLGVCQ